MRQKRRVGFTLVEMLVVIGIIVILMAITLPTVQRAREAARRAECKSNLKNLAEAIEGFESARGTMPPYFGIYPGSPGDYWPTNFQNDQTAVYGSWLVHILPYIDRENIYEQMRADVKNRGNNWGQNAFFRGYTTYEGPQVGFGTAGGGGDGSETQHSETKTSDVTIHHGAKFDEVTTGYKVQQSGFASPWLGHTGESGDFVMVPQKEKIKTDDAWDERKSKTWTVNWTEVSSEAGKSNLEWIDFGSGGKWVNVGDTVVIDEVGGLPNFSGFALKELMCASDPTGPLYGGMSPKYSQALFPGFRKDLQPVYEFIQADPWGTTNYIPNWNAFTDGTTFIKYQVRDKDNKIREEKGYKPPFNSPVSSADILDGTSNTIMLGEGYSVCDRVPRLAFYNAGFFDCFGLNWRFEANTYMYQSAPPADGCINYRSQTGHLHMNVAMCDGSVRSISNDITRADTSVKPAWNVDPEPYRIANPIENSNREIADYWFEKDPRSSNDSRPLIQKYGPPMFLQAGVKYSYDKVYNPWDLDTNGDGIVNADDPPPPDETIDQDSKPVSSAKTWDFLMLPRDGATLDDVEDFYF